MALPKLKLLDKIIIVSFATTLLTLLGYIAFQKKANRDFYLPAQYSGWVKIRYLVPGAPALESIDGVQQIVIPDSGVLDTSSPLEIGWRRDRFFRMESNTPRPIATYEQSGSETRILLHMHSYYARNYESLLQNLPVGADTTLPDNTRLRKPSERRVSYTAGKKSIEYFYISAAYEAISFTPPPFNDPEALQDMGDKQIPAPR
ncbi:MAG: hypothetical protein EAZ89_06075 [Bacteroidetes bacterium]|nr:MAG: hypothetical protein EAZ89_06075 [Bacteroidota bacterium]